MGTGGVVGIVVRDVSLDGGDARVEGVEDRILQPLPGQLREEPLDGMVRRVDAQANDVAGYPESPDPMRPEAVLLQDGVQTIPGLPAGARTVRCRACGGGGDIARAIGVFTRSSGVGFFPGGRVASRRSPSTPSARKRSHRRRTVGFDRPVRRMVPASLQPEPIAGTMRARQTCFRRLRGLLAMRSRRARSSSESTIACPFACFLFSQAA